MRAPGQHLSETFNNVSVENAEPDGTVAVTVTGAPQYSNSQNTVMSATCLCGVTGIAQ